MTKTSSFAKGGVIALCAAAMLAPISILAATPAGTKIQAAATAEYQSTIGEQMPTATSNTVTVTVAQSVSVKIVPSSQRKHVSANGYADFGVTITNTGGASDTFDLSASAAYGSGATIYRDDNGDGYRQPGETTVVSSTGALASGAACSVVVRTQLPSSGGVASDTVTVTAKSRADTTKTATCALTLFKTTADASYVTSWLVNASHANADQVTRLSKDYLGGESGAAPVEGNVTAGITWRKLTTGSAYVDLGTPYGNPTACAGYAFTYVYVPAAVTAEMRVGSDDGVKIWLNGQLRLTNDVYRVFAPDADRFAVDFVQGWNKLLVKVSQGDTDWGFSVRICDSSGQAIPGLICALATTPMGDTTPPTISNVKITPDVASAKVEWDTNEMSTSRVEYGTSSSLGTNRSDAVLVTHHAITLTGLMPGTTYYAKVGSADASGNLAWATGYAFETTESPVAAGAYIQSWLVNGFYTNSDQSTRLSKDYIGNEAYLQPTEGSVNGSREWFVLQARDNYLDMAEAFGYPSYCAGYAACYVYSPVAQTVGMWIGSNDGVKVWLNGKVVWLNDVYRSFVMDKDKTSVALDAGWNRLLVRLSQGTGSWGLSVKFCDSAGNEIPGLAYRLTPALVQDKTPPDLMNLMMTTEATSATIEWDSDEPSTSLLDYGTTTSFGTTYTDTSLVTHHSATITGLTPETMYYVKAGSADASGNLRWVTGYAFFTKSAKAAEGAYVQTWLVNGYYPNADQATRLSKDYIGGEAKLAPVAGSVSGSRTWFRFDAPDNYLDMAAAFNGREYCAAYAACYVYSPVTQAVKMWIGSNDGVKVWLNGEVVWYNDVYRSFEWDKDRASVTLTEGWNRLLIRLSNGRNSWGLSVKFCDAAGNFVPDLEYSISPGM